MSCLLLIALPAHSHSVPSGTLDSLRTALHELDLKLESDRATELDISTQLDLAQQRLNLQQQLLREHRTLAGAIEDSVETLEHEIDGRESELLALGLLIIENENRRREMSESMSRAMLVDRRLASWTTMEFLLGSSSWRELAARRSVLNRLEQAHDSEIRVAKLAVDTLMDLESKIVSETALIKARRNELAYRQSQAESLRVVHESDSRKLKHNRIELRQQLVRVRNDRGVLQKRRDEIAEAHVAIQDMISRIARGEPVTGLPLVLLKGSLPRPVVGKVISYFGLQKNRDIETVTENPGIDFAADPDAGVIAVADGRVSSVSWLRGYGNVCIIEHAGSYFTVYAKLGDVGVGENDMVKSGDLVGYPGFDVGAEEYRVHFELWFGKEKRDPIEWLTSH